MVPRVFLTNKQHNDDVDHFSFDDRDWSEPNHSPFRIQSQDRDEYNAMGYQDSERQQPKHRAIPQRPGVTHENPEKKAGEAYESKPALADLIDSEVGQHYHKNANSHKTRNRQPEVEWQLLN